VPNTFASCLKIHVSYSNVAVLECEALCSLDWDLLACRDNIFSVILSDTRSPLVTSRRYLSHSAVCGRLSSSAQHVQHFLLSVAAGLVVGLLLTGADLIRSCDTAGNDWGYWLYREF
jgi:hypothetical protein